MGKYTALEKKLEREIDEISRKDMTGPSLDILDKMAHTLKSLKTIDAMEGYSDDDDYKIEKRNRDSFGSRYMDSRDGREDRYPERYR